MTLLMTWDIVSMSTHLLIACFSATDFQGKHIYSIEFNQWCQWHQRKKPITQNLKPEGELGTYKTKKNYSSRMKSLNKIITGFVEGLEKDRIQIRVHLRTRHCRTPWSLVIQGPRFLSKHASHVKITIKILQIFYW